jgi:hypothetical protein
MAGTATKLHVLDHGSMSCDLTWLWSLRRSPDGHYT